MKLKCNTACLYLICVGWVFYSEVCSVTTGTGHPVQQSLPLSTSSCGRICGPAPTNKPLLGLLGQFSNATHFDIKASDPNKAEYMYYFGPCPLNGEFCNRNASSAASGKIPHSCKSPGQLAKLSPFSNWSKCSSLSIYPFKTDNVQLSL